MNEFTQRAVGDGIPLLTEIVELPEESVVTDSPGEAAAPATDAVSGIMQQFRQEWPARIEAQCRLALQPALEQLVSQLAAELTETLETQLAEWLKDRLPADPDR